MCPVEGAISLVYLLCSCRVRIAEECGNFAEVAILSGNLRLGGDQPGVLAAGSSHVRIAGERGSSGGSGFRGSISS